jgi:hypothetical protein
MSRTYVTFGNIVGKLHMLRHECDARARAVTTLPSSLRRYGHQVVSVRAVGP